jgi:hypothetical protein
MAGPPDFFTLYVFTSTEMAEREESKERRLEDYRPGNRKKPYGP